MEPGNPKRAISLEWLEERYGCAAQDIFQEMLRADQVANDVTEVKGVKHSPKVA